MQPINNRLSEQDFIAKIGKLDEGLNSGKMWLNDKCEMQVKSYKIVRWIKCILSIILPINLFSSIKASRVASSYFQFLETHKEFLQNENTAIAAKKVLNTLNLKTGEKYSAKINICLAAVDGLKVPKAPEAEVKENLVGDYLKKLTTAQMQELLNKNGIKLAPKEEVAVKEVEKSQENPVTNEEKANILTTAFDALINAAETAQVKEQITAFKNEYVKLDDSEDSKHKKEKILITLDGMNNLFPFDQLAILQASRRIIAKDLDSKLSTINMKNAFDLLYLVIENQDLRKQILEIEEEYNSADLKNAAIDKLREIFKNLGPALPAEKKNVLFTFSRCLFYNSPNFANLNVHLNL